MKAIGLLSGGLDSLLACKLIKDQGIKVIAVNFISPFCTCNREGCSAVLAAKQLDVDIKVISKGKEYLKIIRNPKHGYGKNMNPCIDCRIFMLKKVKKLMKELNAKFIFTGEVLGQRPMSQHMKAMKLIEKEAGLENKILRPLSAKLLKETEAEKKGWVDRNKLLSIQGRSRKEQIKLAKGLNYPCPAGGCLLTDKEFSKKLRVLFKHKKKVNFEDIELLKIGRHFWIGKNWVVVGRNEKENKKLENFKGTRLEPVDFPGPTVLLQGKNIKRAKELLLKYSKKKGKIKNV